MLSWQFSNIIKYFKIVGKIPDQHLNVWLFSNPGDKVQKGWRIGCSNPNTYMEFGLVWPPTGCRLTPLMSIQNPDPEKCQEVSERELASFSVMKKNRVPDMGEKWCGKKQSPRVLGLCFFLTSWHFSGSGFWILTKGVKRQPVGGQTRPNSI